MSKKAFLSVLLIALIVIGGLHLVENLQGKEWNAYAVSSVDDWTMFRHDPSHSGCATGKNQTDSGRLLWVYPTYRIVYSSPAVANGCVFIGSRDGYVYCLSATYGELVGSTGSNLKFGRRLLSTMDMSTLAQKTDTFTL